MAACRSGMYEFSHGDEDGKRGRHRASARGAHPGSGFADAAGSTAAPELVPMTVPVACGALRDARHTSASLMLAAGVNARLISQLGHSTTAFTLDTYSHLLPDADAEAAEQLAAMLGNGH